MDGLDHVVAGERADHLDAPSREYQLPALPARTAIGTASAIALPVAVAGTIGYIVNGWSIAGLPGFSLGFIHLPALGAIVVATVLIAPFDARASHRLPVPILKKALAAVHYAVTLRSLLAWA